MGIFEWLRKKKRQSIPKYFNDIVIVNQISDIPDQIGNNVYVVRRGKRNIWAVFMCPCGKEHRLTVNLSENRRPYWRAHIKRKNFTLNPSIWLKEDCYSHFWVEDHRILWVDD